jgi:hypothetical protein
MTEVSTGLVLLAAVVLWVFLTGLVDRLRSSSVVLIACFFLEALVLTAGALRGGWDRAAADAVGGRELVS